MSILQYEMLVHVIQLAFCLLETNLLLFWSVGSVSTLLLWTAACQALLSLTISWVCQSSCPLNGMVRTLHYIFQSIFFLIYKNVQFHKRKMSFLQIKTSLQVFLKKYQVYKFYKIINFSSTMHDTCFYHMLNSPGHDENK